MTQCTHGKQFTSSVQCTQTMTNRPRCLWPRPNLERSRTEGHSSRRSMTAIFGQRHTWDESPTYNHAIGPATPPLPYHGFAPSRHHVAAHLVNMAGYYDDEASVNAQPSQMSADGQPRRQDCYAPDDDTPNKRQKRHHSSPRPHDACTIASPAPEVPYARLPHTSALLAAHSDASSQQHFDMLPPQDSVHTSWQALHEYAQSHASQHGYALSINTTAKNRSRIKLACVCYGQPKNTHKLTAETRVRKNRVSYKTGCKMWIEGKKLEDGTWLLRVGEAQHNHPGRDSAGWAVQRKRTWGLVGGRIGVGGVTAKEELAKRRLPGTNDILEDVDVDAEAGDDYAQPPSPTQKPATHSLERGGLVWKIVEQEMLRKGKPNQGRDRGVGRTVDVLQRRLPGIHILKRDVYNIRAQIKRARKAAGQQLGDGCDSSNDEVQDPPHATITLPNDDIDPQIAPEQSHHPQSQSQSQSHIQPPPTFSPPPPPHHHHRSPPTKPASPTRKDSRIDPSLVDTLPPSSSLPPLPPPSPSSPDPSGTATGTATTLQVLRLRRENAELRRLLADKTKEVKEKTIEMAGLKSQVELLSNLMLTSGRGLMES